MKDTQTPRAPQRRPARAPRLRPRTPDDYDNRIHGRSDVTDDVGDLDEEGVPGTGPHVHAGDAAAAEASDDDVIDPADDEFVGCEYQATPASRPRGVFAPAWVLDVTRSRAELLVLAQLAYWCGEARGGQPRAKIRDGGYYWVAKTHARLGREVHLTPGQTRWALRSLQARGLVVSARPDGGRPPLYRISPAAIRAALAVGPAGDADEEEWT